MNVLVLNGSPRPNGNTARMVASLQEGAEAAGHSVSVFEVAHMDISGCRACEYCHGRGAGKCAIDDDMSQIYGVLANADVLVFASPIYYHGFSGQLKCVIDRFYSAAYPQRPERLRKAACILCSGASDQYDGALYSYRNDFLGYLGLEDRGVITVAGSASGRDLATASELGRSL